MKRLQFVYRSSALAVVALVLSGCSALDYDIVQIEMSGDDIGRVNMIEAIPYRVVTEEDISYAGCKRSSFRIVVPDDSEKTEVETVMKKIINSNKAQWDDITVWAYKDSEEDMVGKVGHTMGMMEYSICK
jgi:hypothetical protein